MTNLYEPDDVPASRLISIWVSQGLEEATRNGTVAAALHAACYVCSRAVAADLMTPGGALGDDGLLHRLIHAAAGDVSIDMGSLRERIAHIEDNF